MGRKIGDVVKYASEKIGNLSPLGLESLELLYKKHGDIVPTELVALYKKGWKPVNRATVLYWTQRGWTQEEAMIRTSKMFCTVRKNANSPFSIRFWMKRINPDTLSYYTKEEAQFECDKRRPIKKEYWLSRGYTMLESEKMAIQTKKHNNTKGAAASRNRPKKVQRSISKRCVEYWLLKGFNWEQSIEMVSLQQSTFSLRNCIDTYGPEKGHQIWKDRQERWQKTLNSKSEEEKREIVRNRSNWKNKLGFYSLYLGKLVIDQKSYYKIGITNTTLGQRHKSHHTEFHPIETYEIGNFIEARRIEDLILTKYSKYLQTENYFKGYTESFTEELPIIEVKDTILNEMHNR